MQNNDDEEPQPDPVPYLRTRYAVMRVIPPGSENWDDPEREGFLTDPKDPNVDSNHSVLRNNLTLTQAEDRVAGYRDQLFKDKGPDWEQDITFQIVRYYISVYEMYVDDAFEE